MNCNSNTYHPNLTVLTCAGRVFAWIGRVLLMLTALLLITTPLTQHIWTWDHFLRGGQDYESSTLLVLAFFCLVLVLAQHGKQSVSLFFAARPQSSFLSRDLRLAGMGLVQAFSISRSEGAASPGLEMCSLPLQI